MSDVEKIAAEFVNALASGDSSSAHEFLSRESAAKVTAAELSSHFESLAEDMGGVTGIGQPMVILEEWPDMSAHDQEGKKQQVSNNRVLKIENATGNAIIELEEIIAHADRGEYRRQEQQTGAFEGPARPYGSDI